MEQLAQLLQGEEDVAGNKQLIAAIQALREKNSELHEKNAELAQEALVRDSVQHVQLPRATWQPGEPQLHTYRSAMPDPMNPVAVVQGGTVQVPPNREVLGAGGSVLMMPGGSCVSGTMPASGMVHSGSVLVSRGSVQVGPTGVPRTNSPRREASKENAGGVVRSLTPVAGFTDQAQHVRGASPERRATVVVTGVPPGAMAVQQPMPGWRAKHT